MKVTFITPVVPGVDGVARPGVLTVHTVPQPEQVDGDKLACNIVTELVILWLCGDILYFMQDSLNSEVEKCRRNLAARRGKKGKIKMHQS